MRRRTIENAPANTSGILPALSNISTELINAQNGTAGTATKASICENNLMSITENVLRVTEALLNMRK